MKEAPGSSETSVLTRATRRNNPEDTIPLCGLLINNKDKYTDLQKEGRVSRDQSEIMTALCGMTFYFRVTLLKFKMNPAVQYLGYVPIASTNG
jgi:hypothetical protein